MSDVDFLDRRGRLIRIAISVALAALVTYLTLGWMSSVTGEPNPDPMSQAGRVVVGIAAFSAVTWLGVRVLSAVARRLRR